MKRINKSIKRGLSAIWGEARIWALDKQDELEDDNTKEFNAEQMKCIWDALDWIADQSGTEVL